MELSESRISQIHSKAILKNKKFFRKKELIKKDHRGGVCIYM